MPDNIALAIEAVRANQPSQAKIYLTREIQDHPDSAEAWYQMGLLVDEHDKRIFCFLQAVKFDPEQARYWVSLGNHEPDPSQRKICFEKALAADPFDPLNWDRIAPHPSPFPDVESPVEIDYMKSTLPFDDFPPPVMMDEKSMGVGISGKNVNPVFRLIMAILIILVIAVGIYLLIQSGLIGWKLL